MNRQKLVLLTVAGALAVATGSAAAQAPKPAAAPAQGAPAERARLVAPVRGVAQIGYTKPVVKRGKVGDKDFVITTMQIKNMAAGPIAGLKVDDFWATRAAIRFRATATATLVHCSRMKSSPSRSKRPQIRG